MGHLSAHSKARGSLSVSTILLAPAKQHDCNSHTTLGLNNTYMGLLHSLNAKQPTLYMFILLTGKNFDTSNCQLIA